MSYRLRRERRRLIEDLNDLQIEEDLQEQYQYLICCLKELRRHRSYSDDNEYRNYHQQRTESCLVTLIYQSPNTGRSHFDEIEILQHNRTVFKGCLACGGQLTFKSKRYRNESKLKLRFYINGLFEDEMIACCEHGLIDQSNQQKLKTESPTILTPQTRSNHKTSSEGFSSDLIKRSNHHTQKRHQLNDKQQSTEDLPESLPESPEVPLKPIYGPPQISTVLSLSESLDSSQPNIPQQTNQNLFNSLLIIKQNSVEHENSNVVSNESVSDLPNRTTQCSLSLSPNVESNSDERDTSLNLNTSNSNDTAIVNEATQLLLTRLGLIQQQQIESPQVSFGSVSREKGNVEYFTLVYLHASHPDESIIKKLRSLVNFVKIFNDIDDCIAFINGVFNEKIIFILSNSLCNSILPRIEGLQQIFTMYILCENDDEINSSWQQLKVKGVYKNLNDIYEQISKDIQKIIHDLIIYINLSSNSAQLDETYIYGKLLSEIILDKNESQNDLQELINFSRQEYDGNDEELNIIDEFEKNYKKNQAIYWFTRQCFLSKVN
ncbi:unnamed protein product [Rotaria sp. Silwood1]|nr:unnamed protein product [Rotaria sp. Silwood1]CAF1185447.1 unnamed protein product [Rotaria sp. Silwood1]